MVHSSSYCCLSAVCAGHSQSTTGSWRKTPIDIIAFQDSISRVWLCEFLGGCSILLYSILHSNGRTVKHTAVKKLVASWAVQKLLAPFASVSRKWFASFLCSLVWRRKHRTSSTSPRETARRGPLWQEEQPPWPSRKERPLYQGCERKRREEGSSTFCSRHQWGIFVEDRSERFDWSFPG